MIKVDPKYCLQEEINKKISKEHEPLQIARGLTL